MKKNLRSGLYFKKIKVLEMAENETNGEDDPDF